MMVRRASGSSPLSDIHNNTPEQLPSGILTPSPDELVIQQRGRRRMPTTWSPITDSRNTSMCFTPPKNQTGTKVPFPLRTSPRKRLLLEDRVPLSPEKLDFTNMETPEKFKLSPSKTLPSIKRLKLERPADEFKGPIDVALKGLSHSQLIDIIRNMIQKHPELDKEVRIDLPAPDLRPLEEKLSALKSNIFKSLPTSRLTSRTDSPSYSRAAIHLNLFKKAVIDQGKILVESQQWSSVIDYVLMAWRYVKATPVWDNNPHNAYRRHCFKSLISYLMVALKSGAFTEATLSRLAEKLARMVEDSEEVLPCQGFVEKQLQAFF